MDRILISFITYLSTYPSLPAWGDGWGPRSPREPQEVEAFREERGGDASQVQGTSTSASQVQGGWEHIYILRWSDQKTTCDMWSVWPRPCDLTKNCLAAEHVQVEQEKAVHHRWHWCNSHGLLHVFSQVIQNLFFWWWMILLNEDHFDKEYCKG